MAIQRSEVSKNTSTPNLTQFVPLDGQLEVIKAVRKADYSKGTYEFLLSGSVGSSKSLTAAHIAVTHALLFQNSNVLLGRLALPQLKATLCQKIRQHCYNIGLDVVYNSTTGNFRFPNGSTMTAISWSDKNYDKLGSFEASCAIIEELVETKERDFYDKILQRVGRLPHVPEKFILSATNPSSPSSVWYKHLIDNDSDMVQVFYSNTRDNPYLDPSYISGLMERLDEKQCKRMIEGLWIEINEEVIYYEYDKAHNFIPSEYTIMPRYPIRLLYDFNIGQGKPLSLVLAQYHEHNDTWHIFDEIIIEGQRTVQSLEEMEGRGYFDEYKKCGFIVHGDASGKAKDTRGFQSDYEIIDKYLSNLDQRINFDIQLPKKNGSIRDRHNMVNGYLRNAHGNRKLFVYNKCEIVDEGFRLTALKDRGLYIEDDSKHYQHCTTAIGYGIVYVANNKDHGYGAGGNL